LSVDNSAMVTRRKTCNMRKVLKCYRQKKPNLYSKLFKYSLLQWRHFIKFLGVHSLPFFLSLPPFLFQLVTNSQAYTNNTNVYPTVIKGTIYRENAKIINPCTDPPPPLSLNDAFVCLICINLHYAYP